MSVLIDNRQENIIVDEALEALVEQVIKKVLDYEGCEEEYEVSISFVDDEEMRSLNMKYRGIDKETDVLSFPMAEFFEPGIEEGDEDSEYVEEEVVLGDIVISMKRVLEQSKEYGHSFNRELAFLLVHGMMHLLGYNHENEAAEGEMFDIQEEILKEMNLTR
ncbi:MAG TPA: rRNA maturation RNase YbeY [Bacillota bacterium]|nr:rRNA maturation RNase YbeY [Bacillota bacterium]